MIDIAQLILTITSILTGASLILKYIVPLTKNKVDDDFHERIIKILKFLSQDSEYGERPKIIMK